MHRRPISVQAALAVAIVVGSVLGVYASGSSPGRHIAYTGRLEKNGTAQNGTVDLRFGIFSAETDDPGCLATGTTECGEWATEMTAVQLHGGAFSVAIGPLPDSLFQYGRLRYLGVAVGDAEGWRALNGLQALLPAPSAHGGPASDNLIVAHDIETAGAVRVTRRQSLTVPATQDLADAQGSDVDVHGWANDPAISIGAFRSLDRTQGVGVTQDGIRAIGTAANQDLHLRPKGTGSVNVPSSLDVAGGLDVGGNLAVAGAGTVTGDLLVNGLLQGGVSSASVVTANYRVQCTRISRVQVCFGRAESRTQVTLPSGFAFINTHYGIATAAEADEDRTATVQSISTTGFFLRSWTSNGDNSDFPVRFTAIGLWY